MASIPDPSRRPHRAAFIPGLRATATSQLHRFSTLKASFAVVAFAFASLALLSPAALRAQSGSPHITAVTPGAGKADDTITITGQNLGKDKVAAVFLSDAKLDHKAVVVDQEGTKIVIKVPDGLKAGDYNISVEEGGAIYIQPVIFTVKT